MILYLFSSDLNWLARPVAPNVRAVHGFAVLRVEELVLPLLELECSAAAGAVAEVRAAAAPAGRGAAGTTAVPRAWYEVHTIT